MTYLPDPIERGEMRAEDWYFDNVRNGIATCGCGKQFKLEDGQSLSPDPYAIPVCPGCFESAYNAAIAAKSPEAYYRWRQQCGENEQ